MRLIDADALTFILEEMEEEACDGMENDGSDGTTRVLLPICTTTREMIDLIADQPTVEPAPQWIPVTEKVPEDLKDVLCWYSYYNWGKEKMCYSYGIAYRCYDRWFVHGGSSDEKVIAWMSIPEPPKGE